MAKVFAKGSIDVRRVRVTPGLKRWQQEKMAKISDVFDDFRTLGRSDARTLGRPDARTPGRPGVRTPERPTPGRSDAWASGRPDARTPIFLFFSIFAAAAARARAGPRRLEPGRAVTSRAAPARAGRRRPALRRPQKLRKTNEKNERFRKVLGQKSSPKRRYIRLVDQCLCERPAP